MSKKDNLYERGDAARNERLAETADRQQAEIARKQSSSGTGIFKRGSESRNERLERTNK